MDEKIYNRKISRELTLITICIVSTIVLICCLVNALFLDDFYRYRKKVDLMNMYNKIVSASNEGNLESDEFTEELESVTLRANAEVIVIDMDSNTIIYSGKDANKMRMTLWDQIFAGEGPQGADLILEQRNNYQISVSTDLRSGTEYIEMWGVLENDNIFLIRSPMESIQESARLANLFLGVTGLIVLLTGGMVIFFITRKVTKPILDIAEISNRVRALDFDAKYVGKDRNEIGILGNNINKMSESLEKTISKLKNANAELQRDIEKKEKFEEMRSEFVSNVSHELKTPIAIIQGYAEGLMEGISDDKESRDYYCSVICDETSKMNRMVKQLLTLNELEMGTKEINLERFDIMQMIRNRMQTTEIINTNEDVKFNLFGPETMMVWADEFKMEEVFTNLFSNAINHCGGERIIDVHVENVKDKVRVSVFNTGDAIPEEAIGHVFEKFYKVDKARTREYGGSGIGLSIVKAIQDSMGQGYGVENVDDGVVFWVDVENA